MVERLFTSERTFRHLVGSERGDGTRDGAVVLGVFGGCGGSAVDIVGGEAVEALRICDCILEILAMDL